MLALFLGSIASGQGSRAYVLELNRKAMEAYTDLDVVGADNLLHQALEVAQRGGVTGAPLARTYMNLGVVAIGGRQDHAQAVHYFGEALRIDPTAELDPLTSTPDVRAAFQLARASRPGGSPSYVASTASGESRNWYQRAPRPTPRKGKLGASCRGSADCLSGLVCSERACAFDTGSDGDDEEEDGEDEESRDEDEDSDEEVPRAFLRLGVGLGAGLANGKMWSDRDPSGDAQGTLAYVPSGTNGCSAPTGDFCVRVEQTGLLPIFAARATLGYYVTSRVSLAATVRYQFDAGLGTMSHMLLGARLGYLATTPTAEGLAVAPFLGFSYGQIQLHPSQGDLLPRQDQPYTMSGLTGFQLGTSLTYRVSRTFGVHLTPEVHVHFPAFLVAGELTVGMDIGM